MSLVSRLIAPSSSEAKISVHAFMAVVAEFKRGAPGVNVSSISTAFGLVGQEVTDLTTLVTQILGDIVTREQVHDVLLLGENGTYDEAAVISRLLTPGTTNLMPLILQREVEVVARSMNDSVLSGCAVTAQGSPNMTLAVAKGSVLSGGVLLPVTAGNVTITAADSTKPRFDLVVVNSAGTKTVRAGTASPSPTPPTLSGGDVVIAFVYVPAAATAITTSLFFDSRVFSTAGPVCVGKVTAAIVKNNTNAAQTFVSLTLPSGLFLSGRVIHVSCGGNMLLNSGSPTVTMAISYGGTTMFQDVTAAATADADRVAWTLDFHLVAQANNDQALNGLLQLGPINARTGPAVGVGDIAVPAVLAGVEVSGPFGGAAAVDSDAADRVLAVVFTMSIANAANEIVMEYAYADLL